MASLLRRFAGPVIAFLIGGGLEVSGFEDVRIAIGLWSIAGIWTMIALFTWEPVLRVVRSIRRIRIVIVNSEGSKPKRGEERSVEEKGLLDHRVAAIKEIPKMASIINKMTKETNKFAKKVKSHAAYAESTQDPIKLRKNASKLSRDIERHSKVTERFLTDYKRGNSVLNESVIPLIKRGEYKGIRQSVEDFLKETGKARQSCQAFRDSALRLATISQDLKRACRRFGTLLENVIEELEHTESFCNRALSIL